MTRNRALVPIDTSTFVIPGKAPLEGVPEPGQVARYSPNGRTLLVTSLRSAAATVMDAAFDCQTTMAAGLQPMDAAFHEGLLFVACHDDGSIHVIDLAARRVARRFDGRETLAFS